MFRYLMNKSFMVLLNSLMAILQMNTPELTSIPLLFVLSQWTKYSPGIRLFP